MQTALKEMRGTDNRPLLILRGSAGSDKSLDSLVDRSFKNERVQLASQWFHCVKVGKEVLDPSHPLHALFQGTRAPRVILSSWDTQRIVRALGTTKQKLDWQDVLDVLKVDYKKSPAKHVKELMRVLDKFDKVDGLRKSVADQLKRAEEKNQKSKIRRLRAKLAKLDKDFEQIATREKEYQDLGLRRAEEVD